MNPSAGLISQWPLETAARDVSKANLSATIQGVTFGKVDGHAAGHLDAISLSCSGLFGMKSFDADPE